MKRHFRIGLALLFIAAVGVAFTHMDLFSWSENQELTKQEIQDRYRTCLQEPTETAIGNCMQQLAKNSLIRASVPDFSAAVASLSYQEKNRWCHEVMHYMGWESYDASKSIAQAFMNASELCDSGMYHGIMEQHVRVHGINTNVPAFIHDVCETATADKKSVSAGVISLCYHGIGHGLMFITAHNLQAALDFCDTLENMQAHSCYSGAFMEHTATKAVDGNITKDLSDFQYCEDLRPHQHEVCYSRQGANNLQRAGGDVAQAMEYCLSVPEKRRQPCFIGVGSNTPTPGRSHYDSGSACNAAQTVSENAYTSCILGGAGFVAQLEQGDPQGLVDFCSAIESSHKEFCYTQAGLALTAWITPDTSLAAKCSAFTDQTAQDLCAAAE